MTKPDELQVPDSHPERGEGPDALVARLLRQLDVQPQGQGRFRAPVEQEEGRLFGGLVLAQAVMAAGRDDVRGNIHSLHAYFLRGGKPAKDITFQVERLRDGRNFTTRRVTAIQDGDAIFEASVGFVMPEPGLSFAAPMPDVPGPEGQPSWWESIALPEDAPPRRNKWFNPIEIRAAGKLERIEQLPRRHVWAKPCAPLPDDPLLHAAAIAYMSDSGMVATVANHFGMWTPGGATASLDHAIWFHHPPRFDDWLLYATESPAAHAARGLMFGGMYTRDGVRVASVAQEGLFRNNRRE